MKALQMTQTGIYWIRHKDHTDLLTQGYVGVTKNLKERLRHHFKNAKGGYHSDKNLSKAIAKYGEQNIQANLILISNNQYCYEIEKKLRPTPFIGWNMREGGYHTPNPFPTGSKMPKEIIEKAQETIKAKRQLGQVGRDKAILVNGQRFNRIKDAREAFGISKTQMTRILRGVSYNTSNKGNTQFAHLEIKYASS
jgi:predicted GIY-YIG superfamily endonuclease